MRGERAFTVLNIDDDPLSRRATLRLLRQAGYRTRQATSSAQALRSIAKERPDLVILNRDLEGGRGPALAQQIRSLPQGRDLPLLHLASAQAAPDQVPEGVQLGLDGYLTRPLNAAEFLALAQTFAETHRKAVACAAAARQWQAAFDAIPCPMCLLDLEGRILLCNQGMLLRVGQSAEQILARNCQEVLVELGASTLQTLLAQLQETGARQAVELQVQDHWCELALEPMQDPEEGLIGAVLSAADITPRRQYEEELTKAREEAEEQRRFLQAVLDHAPSGIVMMDEQARVVFSNPTADAILARPAPLGKDYEHLAELGLLRPDGAPYSPRELPPVRAALDGQATLGAEATVVLPDGSKRDLLGNANPIRDEAGRVIGAVLVFQDITERKQTQKELERLLEVEQARVQEAALLAAVLQNTPSAIAYVNREGCYAFVNPAYVKASGRREKDFLGHRILDYFPQPEYQAAFQRVLETGRPFSRKEAPLELPARPEAGITYWDFTLTPMKDESGEVTGVLLTAMEVTDKVRSRQRLAAAERDRAREARLLTTIQEAVPNLIAYVDRDLRYVCANSHYADSLGFTPEQLRGRSVTEVLSQAPYALAAMRRVLRTGETVQIRESPPVAPRTQEEAQTDRFDVVLTPVKDERGQVEGLVISLTEVTQQVQTRERIAAAERARAAEARLLTGILEATPSLIAYVDRDLCYRLTDTHYAEGLGFSREGIIGQCHAELFAHAPHTSEWLQQVIASGEEMVVRELPSAVPLAGREEEQIYVDLTMTPVKDEQGNVEGVVISVLDVTDQVQARHQIAAAERERAAEARMLSAILEAVPGMVAYLDRDLRYRHANTKMAQALGLNPEKLIGALHHDSLRPLDEEGKANLARLFRTGEPMVMVEQKPVFPITWRDPTPYDAFNISIIPVKDEAGDVEGIAVFVTDVTDAVAQREKLLETERARARLAETLNEEINHRVKNNLMMVVGLLQMQLAGETDSRAAAALHDAMTRLLTFAEIHTQLRFAETEEVDLLAMTRRIAEVTQRVFAKADVALQVEGESIPCSAKEATPLLIVINELITNAVKHGGPAEDGKLHVEIAVRREAESVHVSIWSSGNPLPEDFDPQQQRTLGMTLSCDVIIGRYRGAFTLRPDRGGTRAEVEVAYSALKE